MCGLLALWNKKFLLSLFKMMLLCLFWIKNRKLDALGSKANYCNKSLILNQKSKHLRKSKLKSTRNKWWSTTNYTGATIGKLLNNSVQNTTTSIAWVNPLWTLRISMGSRRTLIKCYSMPSGCASCDRKQRKCFRTWTWCILINLWSCVCSCARKWKHLRSLRKLRSLSLPKSQRTNSRPLNSKL